MKNKLKNKRFGAAVGSTHSAFAFCVALAFSACSRSNQQITPEQLTVTPELVMAARSPNEAVLASVSTVRPAFRSVANAVKANGVVAYDSRHLHSVSARVAGRLEAVHLKYAYQRVLKGDKIAEIYSPELLEAQRQLLFLIRDDPTNGALIAGARKKLQLLGLSPAQVDGLIAGQEVEQTVVLYSPYAGYLLPNGPVSSPEGGNPDNIMNTDKAMGSASATSPYVATGSFLREGSYVSAGQTLFTIADDNALRIDLNLPASLSGAVRAGDSLTFTLDDGTKRAATVERVQPFFDQQETFSRVRVYPKDVSDLQIGQLVKAPIHLEETESLWLPREAVLELGMREVVFVSERGMLKPKVVATGIRTGDMIEITSGLASIDAVAANAHFLVDSESFVKPIN
jgi:multidrug efflux pump subunit AcrA (membrane-fusion protein)